MGKTAPKPPQSRVPREGGDPEVSRTDRPLALIWIPAFAGKTVEGVWKMLILQLG
jgi:hypothetical protein